MLERKIVLDTETTGLDPKSGHRIIEIGCIELIGYQFTNNNFHTYIDPKRPIDKGAQAVHGITTEFLQGKPLFADIVDEFLAYIEGGEIIVHNAPFDINFLDHELSLLKNHSKSRIAHYSKIFDTLTLARKMYPGQRNNLDALCKRYKVDNTNRELHGALLDAKLLAEVYLQMTGGQKSLFDDDLSSGEGKTEKNLNPQRSGETVTAQTVDANRQPLKIIRANEVEAAAHKNYVEKIARQSGKPSPWIENDDE